VLKLVVKLIMVVGIASFGLNLTACNTVEGAGQDVKAVGQGIENSSDNVRDRM
jgi:predicted small secreted protein